MASSVSYRQIPRSTIPALQELPDETALYVHLSRALNPASAPELLHKGLPGTMKQRVERVIIQAHPETAAALTDHPYVIDDLRGRLEVSGVELLTWDTETLQHDLRFLGPQELAPGSAGESTAIIDALRSVDFLTMADRPGALLPDNPEFHYEGPNGNHYTSFLRPGFSLSSLEDLEIICFWLAPLVPANSALVIDTWNLAALGLALANYCRSTRELQLPEGRFPFASVDAYTDDPSILADHIRAIMNATGVSSVFFLVSICGSGQFALSYLEAFQSLRIVVAMVALFATDPDLLPADVTVMQEFRSIRRFDPATCERCLDQTEKSPVIRVLPRSYLLELSGAIQSARIQRDTAMALRDFFSEVSIPGGVTVHRDQHDGQRHHTIHFDVARLLDDQGFKRRCNEMAARLAGNQIQLILCPQHKGAEALARYLANALHVNYVPIDEHALAAAVSGGSRPVQLARCP